MRFVKLFARILRYAIYATLAFVVGAIAVLTLTERGRENLAGLISDLASSPGQVVRIAGIDGIWSGNFRLQSLVLEDADGPWLVARNVAVDWSPLKLFSATFAADRIYAERIEVARTPKPASKPKEEAGSFSLPVSIDLKQIDLPDIALGPALAGGVASVAAKGSARAEASPLQVVSQLNIARSDGRAGAIDASIDFAPDENRLGLDIRASEPQGGILANLLGLPGEPPVEINVSGSGPAANWAGSGTFAVDGTVITRVEGRHQFVSDGSAIEAKGDGDFERFMPENLRPLLSGNSSFDFAGVLTPAGGVRIERGTIESNAVKGTVSGTLDPQGASDFALQVEAAGEGVPLSFGTPESPIDMIVQMASIRALGDGREPNLDIAATLSKVATNDAELDDLAVALHSDSFNIQARTGPVTGTATAAALIIDNPTIAPLVAGKIGAGFAGTLTTDSLTVTDGNLSSDAIAGKFTGDVSLVDGSVTLKLNADVASSALPASVRPALAERVQLDAAIARDHEGMVSADPFSISSGELSASGRVRTANQEIDASISGRLGNVGLLAQGASGAVDLEVTAKGALAAPDVSLAMTSDRIEAAGREIAGLRLTAAGRADMDNPAAEVSLTGTVGGEALDGRANLSTSGGKREVKGLTLSLGKNRIAGDLVLDEKFLPLGTVTFQLPDVGALAALALETVKGDLNGTISFTDNAGKPQLAVNATTKSLARGDLTAADVAIDATVSDYAAAPAVAGRVQAATVTSGTTVVKGIDVKLTQEGGWTGFDGGATVSDIPARASGRVQVADGRTVIELASGQATVRGLQARLARASRVEIANGTTTLDNIALDIGGGNVTVSGTAGSTLNINATLSAVPATVVNNFAPGLDAAGAISGTAKVTGAAANPAVGYSLDWRGAQTAQTRSAGFGGFTITSSGDFSGGRLTFQANAADSAGLGIRGGGTVDTGSRALSLDFSGGVPFSFLSSQLAASGLSLTGTSNVDLQVRGTFSSPAIGGSLSTSGARFVAAASGIAINDIRAEIAMANNVATIRTLTGNLSTGGSLSGSGTVGIAAGSGFPADIKLRINNGRYTDGRVVTTTMNGDLAIKGPLLSQPVLSGTVDLEKTVITVPDRLPGSLAALDVRHKNETEAVRAQQEALAPSKATGGGSGALTLDLTVNANNQIFVTGRGLDAELGGSLKLTGSTAAPEAVGEFTLRRGRLSVLGRRLTFTRGTINFAGSLVPNLDFAADSDVGDTTVTVSVSGPANNPHFNFTSMPALPQDEVLARLIFGRSLSNLSPLQIAQLADAAASLTGGGSSSLLQSLRSQIGVDDLDIRTNEDGSTSVSAGKYLNDRTYFSLEKGDKAGSGKAKIDLDIGRGVKLRGEANDGGEAKGGIFFEREY
ncbi:translocation/assembly module TamB domain-containing protein [Mesorhizobium sp. YM1C-6-2]|uniref:translocation/assembly module TamB domain-containing protein n=1 Tax=Mesorhizobium sp. YM1C-6-2 TaxID=1827501 RepID=UPI000EF1B75C|nr:translocation/assembly module TamB domain-containing protein [Mesorhizobium sp. YM1C-6-2]RLP27167.1 translocation/assembly module TamB [Mesorhizobium sp. YM1C-6-2]